MTLTFHEHTLDNGLTIVGEIDPAAHTTAAGFFVRTGARDESAELMGVSHFLEHMMFKGTATRSADDVNRGFDEIGASHNAFTSAEMTAFFATTLPEHGEKAREILADIMRPALRDEDFQTERGVILEEIAMYKDQPFWVLYERSMEDYYGAHPLAHRVLGTDQTITAMTSAGMKRYFEDRYSADNTTVALAGNVDFDAACAQIERLCGHWAVTNAARDAAAPPTRDATLELTDSKVARAYLLMLAPGPAMDDERRYAAGLLARVLGDPGNSRLHWALVEPGLAEDAQAAFEARDGCGDFYVYASCDPERLPDVRRVAEREIDQLVGSLTEDDLERLRNKMATAVTLAGERPSGRMQRLGRQWTYLKRYRSLEEELERINAVTLDDLRRVYEAFPFRPRTVGTLTPGS